MPDHRDLSADHDLLSLAEREAARHDAAGRHGDAIAVLSEAATAGDLAAMRTVGLRILLGDRAPFLGPAGADLITDAARSGDAAAAHIAAVLAAAGVHQPVDWDRALDWAQHAAQLGWTNAQDALRVLAGLPETSTAATADWARLRQAIEPAALLRPSVATQLSADPLITSYPRFASDRECDWLIAFARQRLKRAQVYNPTTRGLESTSERTNSVAHANLLDTDLVQLALQARISRALAVPFAHFEPLAVLHYAPGQAFEDHYDFVDPDAPESASDLATNGQRLFTVLLYLNDGYEGGETAFPRLALSHRGTRGEAFVFRNVRTDGTADPATLHAGRPPQSGEKWVLSQFVRDRALVPGSA